MSNLQLIEHKFEAGFDALLTDDDIAEYIEGVGSDAVLFMISEICINCPGGMEYIEGLEDFIERIEDHYAYFWNININLV